MALAHVAFTSDAIAVIAINAGDSNGVFSMQHGRLFTTIIMIS